MKYSILLLSLIIYTQNAAAQDSSTFYVDDELTITVRSGESTSHQILRTIKSGTALTITETHPDTGYSKAILNDGTEGWVLTRFLSKTPVARDQLAQAQKRIGQLEKRLGDAEKELKELKQKFQNTSSSLDKQTGDYEKTQKELDHIRTVSANAIALDSENKELKTELIYLETETQALEQQNAALQDSSARNWFITGTAVMLIGIIIGLIAPKLRVQKKSSWGDL